MLTLALTRSLLLALRLSAATTPAAAEAECTLHHAPGGDPWGECVVALEAWRCERQGRCDPAETAPYEAAEPMPLPDPERPGQSYVTGGSWQAR